MLSAALLEAVEREDKLFDLVDDGIDSGCDDRPLLFGRYELSIAQAAKPVSAFHHNAAQADIHI